MDFHPEDDKWQLCCVHLITGLKAWTSVEIVVSALSTVFLVSTCYDILKANTQEIELIFNFGLLFICFLMLIGSILLLVGLQKYEQKLMYFTIFVRATLLVFISAFGVSRFLLRHDHELASASHRRFNTEQEGPSIAVRLVGLIIFMLFVSLAVFFTIYMIVRAIRYSIAYNRLQDRRQSLILASQIDPEMTAYLRRKSHTNKQSAS